MRAYIVTFSCPSAYDINKITAYDIFLQLCVGILKKYTNQSRCQNCKCLVYREGFDVGGGGLYTFIRYGSYTVIIVWDGTGYCRTLRTPLMRSYRPGL